MTTAQTVTLIRRLTGTVGDTNAYSDADLLVDLNAELERLGGVILTETMGGGWKWGDINYTAFPTYTMNLSDSEPFYQIDSLTGPLVILGAEVLDNTGIWHPLDPITLDDIRERGFAQLEYLKTDGRPIEYEKREHAVVLYPAPDNGVSVTLTAGLRILFLRGMNAITSVTDTTALGFPLPWHKALAFGTAHVFAATKGLDKEASLERNAEKWERQLLRFIARRNQDDRPIMSMNRVNYT